MAKLTEEQKQKNKVDQKARDKAFRARRKELEDAEEAALAKFHKETVFLERSEAACAASAKAFDAREEERKALQAEIAVIEQKIKALNVKHNVDALNDVRRKTSNEYFTAKAAVEQAVRDEYKDIHGVYSAVQWAYSKERKS